MGKSGSVLFGGGKNGRKSAFPLKSYVGRGGHIIPTLCMYDLQFGLIEFTENRLKYNRVS